MAFAKEDPIEDLIEFQEAVENLWKRMPSARLENP